MSRAQDLLDAATPRPWTALIDSYDGLPSMFLTGDPAGMQRPFAQQVYPEEARLIEFAVNRLPDYEAAVEALERLERLVSVEWDASTLVGMACTDARAALKELER